MKKIIILILALVLFCSLYSCKNGENEKAPDNTASSKADEASFIATVLEINGNVLTVEPATGENERNSSDKIRFVIEDEIEVEVGDVIEVSYNGDIMETYPAQISGAKIKKSDGFRYVDYTEAWIDKQNVSKNDESGSDNFVITEIYKNCFFADFVIPMPYSIKINGELDDNWCVGDTVLVSYENMYTEGNKMECDMTSIEVSTFVLDPDACDKPVIYLYPEEETDVSVKLTLDGALTCTYPAYNNGWRVTALPDGTLTDATGQIYNYLYWEGEAFADLDMSKGFCVKGKDTAAFLENALAKLGLNRREANEFIVYWLPLMQENAYNIISFQGKAYTDAVKLDVSPSPDTVIRVFMTYKVTDEYVEIPEQELTSPARDGFAVIEWGGTEVK